jgi:hypothetical protein
MQGLQVTAGGLELEIDGQCRLEIPPGLFRLAQTLEGQPSIVVYADIAGIQLGRPARLMKGKTRRPKNLRAHLRAAIVPLSSLLRKPKIDWSSSHMNDPSMYGCSRWNTDH